MLGLQYNSILLGPAIVAGVAAAVFYGLTAVPIVLSYRISRTVGFVNGGLLVSGGLFWFWLSFDSQTIQTQPHVRGGTALVIVTVLGGVIGALFGLAATSRRMQAMPRVTLTTFSLGVGLFLAGSMISGFPGAFETVPSPFGEGKFVIAGGGFSHHQAYTTAFLVLVVVVAAYVLTRTRGGIYVRATADNADAAKLVGVPMRRVATIVYAISGAIAALCGALVTPDLSPEVFSLLFVFLRGLTVCVIGGFNSLPMALAGALLFGITDSFMRSGVFGEFSGAQREVVAVGLLFGIVLLVNRFSPAARKITLSEEAL